jgi:hypothetical protein
MHRAKILAQWLLLFLMPWTLSGCLLTHEMWRADHPEGKKDGTLRGELVYMDRQRAVIKVRLPDALPVRIAFGRGEECQRIEINDGAVLQLTFDKRKQDFQTPLAIPIFSGALIPTRQDGDGPLGLVASLRSNKGEHKMRVVEHEPLFLDVFMTPVDRQAVPMAFIDDRPWDRVAWPKEGSLKGPMSAMTVGSTQPYYQGFKAKSKTLRCIGWMDEGGQVHHDMAPIEEDLRKARKSWRAMPPDHGYGDASRRYFLLADTNDRQEVLSLSRIRCDVFMALLDLRYWMGLHEQVTAIAVLADDEVPPARELPRSFVREMEIEVDLSVPEYIAGRTALRVVATPVTAAVDVAAAIVAIGTVPLWGPLLLIMSTAHPQGH